MLPDRWRLATNFFANILKRQIIVIDQLCYIFSFFCRVPFLDASDMTKSQIRRNVLPACYQDVGYGVEKSFWYALSGDETCPVFRWLLTVDGHLQVFQSCESSVTLDDNEMGLAVQLFLYGDHRFLRPEATY